MRMAIQFLKFHSTLYKAPQMLTAVSDEFAISPQISADQIDMIKEQGFAAIICNRPDDEEPGQPSAAAIQKLAEAAGLVFVHQPVESGAVTFEDVETFKTLYADLPKPLLGYCRSGARCQFLFQAAQNG